MSVTITGEYVVKFKVVFSNAETITAEQLKEVEEMDPSDVCDNATADGITIHTVTRIPGIEGIHHD